MKTTASDRATNNDGLSDQVATACANRQHGQPVQYAVASGGSEAGSAALRPAGMSIAAPAEIGPGGKTIWPQRAADNIRRNRFCRSGISVPAAIPAFHDASIGSNDDRDGGTVLCSSAFVFQFIGNNALFSSLK